MASDPITAEAQKQLLVDIFLNVSSGRGGGVDIQRSGLPLSLERFHRIGHPRGFVVTTPVYDGIEWLTRGGVRIRKKRS